MITSKIVRPPQLRDIYLEPKISSHFIFYIHLQKNIKIN